MLTEGESAEVTESQEITEEVSADSGESEEEAAEGLSEEMESSEITAEEPEGTEEAGSEKTEKPQFWKKIIAGTLCFPGEQPIQKGWLFPVIVYVNLEEVYMLLLGTR